MLSFQKLWVVVFLLLGSSAQASSWGLRANLGFDPIAAGLGFGAGVTYVLPSLPLELSVDYVAHSSDEVSDNGTREFHEITKLGVFMMRANWLFNYAADKKGFYTYLGFGFFFSGVEYFEEERACCGSGTYTTNSDEDGSSAGNTFNFGLGYKLSPGFGLRLELPVMIFYSAGGASAVAIPIVLALQARL